MAECRSLIEFLQIFEQHRRAADSSASAACTQSKVKGGSSCASYPTAAVVLLAALGFVIIPYAMMLLLEVGVLLLPTASCVSAAVFFTAAVAVELLSHHGRKCGKPRCSGLKKAVEFDIQLETEDCLRGRRSPAARSAVLAVARARSIEIGDAHTGSSRRSSAR